MQVPVDWFASTFSTSVQIKGRPKISLSRRRKAGKFTSVNIIRHYVKSETYLSVETKNQMDFKQDLGSGSFLTIATATSPQSAVVGIGGGGSLTHSHMRSEAIHYGANDCGIRAEEVEVFPPPT